LRHDGVLEDVRDDPAQLVAGGGVPSGLLFGGALLREGSEVASLDGHAAGAAAGGWQAALVDPPAHRVVAHPEQGGGLTDPQMRHTGEYRPAPAVGRSTSRPAGSLAPCLCSASCPPRSPPT